MSFFKLVYFITVFNNDFAIRFNDIMVFIMLAITTINKDVIAFI